MNRCGRNASVFYTKPNNTKCNLIEKMVVQVRCLQQLFNKDNEVNKNSKNELEFQLYQFKGTQGERNRRTIRSYINTNTQQRQQPAHEGQFMRQEKIVANLVTTRAYNLECHMLKPTKREMRPTCPKIPGCKKTTRPIFLWFRNVDIMMNNKYYLEKT